MTSVSAYEALVVDRGTVIHRGRRQVPSAAWALLMDTAYAMTDHDTAKTLKRHWDSGYSTVRLVRRFNGRELIYQVRTIDVDAKGNLVNDYL